MPSGEQAGRRASLVKQVLRPNVRDWNAAFSFTWDAGKLTQVDAVDAEGTMRMTLTWTGDELTAMSAWTAV